MSKKLFVVLAVAVMVLGFAPVSKALIYDESTMGIALGNPHSDLYVDWMVLSPDEWNGPGYLYMYQLEVPANVTTSPEHYTVSFDTSDVISYGYWMSDDLDVATGVHPAHTVGGESEPYLFPTEFSVITTLNPDNISWDLIGGLPAGYESPTLYFVHPNAPVMGDAFVLDGAAWGSGAPHGEQVPVPAVPDATTTIILLGAAVMGLGLAARKLA